MTDDHDEIPWWMNPPRTFLNAGELEEDERRYIANVGWVQSRKDFFGYVEGYRRAAETLFESLEHTLYSPEFMVWPLAFLWRHFIEISLKDIIATGKVLQGGDGKFKTVHPLGKLWEDARKEIEATISGDPAQFKHVEVIIREFDKIDEKGDGFRYPLAKNGVDPSLCSDHPSVNLASMHEAMVELANYFDGVRMEMSMRMDMFYR